MPLDSNAAPLLKNTRGRDNEVIRAYRRLLQSHPEDPDVALAAIEAGDWAAERQVPDEARWLLE